MKLHDPFIITSRLMAGVKVGNGFISIETKGSTSEGRTRYHYAIDIPGQDFEFDDLKSGCGGGGLQEGMASLLCFLGAAAESWRYDGKNGANSDLFPHAISEWAAQYSDEIGMLQIEIEESGKALIEN